MPLLDLARATARRRDEQLVALIAQALEPYPVRVMFLEHHPDVIRIVLGRATFLDVPIDPVIRARRPLDELVLEVAREARRRWRDLEPLPVPDNVVLGGE